MYEKRIQKLESRMWDNLEKEGRRRQEAEVKFKECKKKCDELQKIIDLTKNRSSDSDSDSDLESSSSG